MDEAAIYELSKIIQASENIVFFGGAGVSTESNIPDFRSEKGMYNIKSKYNFPPETMLSHSFFINQTSLFYDFYKTSMIFPNAKPNLAHLTLAKLEQMGKLKAVITQNIDGLHQKAGNKNVLELHGTIYKNHCIKCGKEYSAEYVFNSEDIPRCECGSIIKPNVVLYGEMLPEDFVLAEKYISECDLLIVAGTSLIVEPAASLINYFRGKNLVIINNDETPYDKRATLIINEDLTSVFKLLS